MSKPTTLRVAEHYVVTWHHTSADPLDAVLRPDYWAHVAKQLRPHHRIVVDAEDGTWTATLFVRAVSRTDAAVSVVSQTVFNDAPVLPAGASDHDYEVTWGGPAQKFRVIRKNDRSVMRAEFDTRDAASLWLRDHLKTLAA